MGNFSLSGLPEKSVQHDRKISDVCQTISSNFEYFNRERNSNAPDREPARTLFGQKPQVACDQYQQHLQTQNAHSNTNSVTNGDDTRNFILIGGKKIYYQHDSHVINDIIDHDLRKNLR